MSKNSNIKIAVLITDTHFNGENEERVLSYMKQAVDKAEELNVPLYHLGDVFTNRKSQRLLTMLSFMDFCHYKPNVSKTIIPGNHDKTDQNSERSYLSMYKNIPGVKIVEEMYGYDFIDCTVHFLPYFEDVKIIRSKLKQIIDFPYGKEKPKILLTHLGINGVLNNAGHDTEDGLSVDDFEGFRNVFIGHYHNRIDVNKRIQYIGSLYPANFGENNDKGYCILYFDKLRKRCFTEQQKIEFVEYITLNISEREELDFLKQELEKEDFDKKIKIRVVTDSDFFTPDDNDFLKNHGVSLLKKITNEAVLNDIKSLSVIKFERAELIKDFISFSKSMDITGDLFKEGLSILKKNI